MSLHGKKFWIFDMDGTLTKPVHNFPEIKKELGLPLELDILHGISLLTENEQIKKNIHLQKIEYDLAESSILNDGVLDFIIHLKDSGSQIGILTRNNSLNTKITLEVTGLNKYFSEDFILTRDDCPPKPEPDGIFILLAKWKASPSLAVMVGDYIYDLSAGRSANISTAYFDSTSTFTFKDSADYLIHDYKKIYNQTI